MARGLVATAERAGDEPFDIEMFLDARGMKRLADLLDQGHEEIAPGAGALATIFGSIFHMACPAPHTHILLKIEGRFRASAEEFASRYAASDKRNLDPAAHLGSGLVLASLGRHVDALEAYGLAVREGLGGLALCLMAISLASLNRSEKAYRACRKSLRLEPDLALALIALRTHRRALKNPGRRMREPRPLAIFLAMGDEPTCGTCRRPTREPGHICLDVPPVVSFTQGQPDCARMTLLRLCYVGGLCDIAAFRRAKIAMCAYSTLELAMLFLDPVTAMKLVAIRPLVETGVAYTVGVHGALPGLLGGGKGQRAQLLAHAPRAAPACTAKLGANGPRVADPVECRARVPRLTRPLSAGHAQVATPGTPLPATRKPTATQGGVAGQPTPARGPGARQGLLASPAGGQMMTKGIQVSVVMSGDHSVGPDGADEAHASIERALSGSHAEYRIRSSLPGHEFSREGGKGAHGSIGVDLEESSFAVEWNATSTFSAPVATLDAINGCIRPSGKVSVHASITFDQIPEALMNVGKDLFVKKCHMAIFELTTPDNAPGMLDADKISFKVVPVFDEADVGHLFIFGEHRSHQADVPKTIEHLLGALSIYCEAYSK